MTATLIYTLILALVYLLKRIILYVETDTVRVLLMDFRDGRTVEVNEGEILIVPKSVEHKPHTNGEIVFNLLFEPKATLHTGNVESEMTVKELEWV